MSKENYNEQQKMATRGNFEPISQEILNQKFITTLEDMLKLIKSNQNYTQGQPRICKTLARVVTNKEKKKGFLTGMVLGMHKADKSKLPPLIEEYKTLINVLFNKGKIDKFDANALEFALTKIVNQLIEYLAKCENLYIAW